MFGRNPRKRRKKIQSKKEEWEKNDKKGESGDDMYD